MIVPDANVLIFDFLPPAGAKGQRLHANAARALESDSLLVPPLWRAEFLAGALYLHRHAGLARESGVEAYRRALELLEDHEHAPPGELVLQLATDHRLTAQDASYLAVARKKGGLVVTNDGEEFVDRCERSEVFVLERYVRERTRARRR